MKIYKLNKEHYYTNKAGIQGFIKYLESNNGIGHYRDGHTVASKLIGDEFRGNNIFLSEEFDSGYDYEPTLIITDEGEYDLCMLTIYEGMGDSFFEYTY